MFSKKNRFSFKDRLPKQILNFPSFTIRYEKTDGEALKVAVVVSKKVDKRAVVRNRIKRIILETVRKKMELSNPLNVIFYVKAGALNSESLEKDLADVANQLTK